MRTAVLGMGTMGSAISRRLLHKGFSVDVWNRSWGALAPLTVAGVTAHGDPVEAVAAADVVLTMLPTGDAVTEVMFDAGALEAVGPGTIWVQMGTIGIEASERLAAEVLRRRPDVAFVDAPVSGSREPASTGRLVILASGPDRAQAALGPLFAALGQRTVWLGPAGGGSRMKLVLNTLLAFEIEAVAEVAALASRLGVPYADIVKTVAGGPLASTVEMTKLAKIESGDHSADFSLQWALKDLELALKASGVETAPVVMAIAERWRGLVEQGYGELDVSAARLGLVGRAEPVSV